MIYLFIKDHEKIYSIEKMCKVLKVSPSSYYNWKRQILSERQKKTALIKEEITSIYFNAKQRYGSPRITLELQSQGYQISRITVAKYMKQLGLYSKLSEKFKVTTNSKHNHFVVPNILKREFTATEPAKAWVSDITYIQTKDGFLYLTIILDLFDRKIVGWSLSNGLSTKQTTMMAWKMAVKNRTIANELIFHSDRGIQYANKKFADVLDSYKSITRSMSRKGDCWDNAVAESFFKSLKTELVYGSKLWSCLQICHKKLRRFVLLKIDYSITFSFDPQRYIQTKILKTCKDSLYFQYANLFKSSIKCIEICLVEVTTRDKRKISSFVPFFFTSNLLFTR
ncbi:IS3 family transposase [uncultured Flavobacterium sp.]|uniref:IS3 family transposase n=1 Tax=uncultured Flavobacterium sp. TaxID=165435 RepID=UPI002930B2D9|nr:IS3 family transposase [uncultured Flavobacterium sp.]